MSLSEPAARPAIMHDVARLAGVSHQTVSRVLNGHPNVRPETRERVLEAIRRLNYRPNALARGLVTRRSQTIGVISFDTRLFGPASTLLAIEHAARAAGYTITISSLANLDASSVRAAVDALAGQSVDGVIVIALRESAARGLRDLRPGLPVVAVEAGYGGEIPVVSVDQFAGARLAVDHLLSLGHRTVWHVAGPADWLEARERVEGWQASLTTAVFAANDQMALGVLHAFYERGVRVPADVSVVGFDNIPEAAFLIPSLTTVHQDFEELGRRGLKLLVDIMDEGHDAADAPSRVPPALVTRQSSAAPGR